MKEEQDLSAMASSLESRSDEVRPAYSQLPWDDETVTRFWRWQAQRPHEYFTNLFGDRIAAALAPWLRGGDGSVLDYGCGLGFLPRHLAAQGCRVWATDFSPESVEITNQRNQGVAGFQGATVVTEIGQHGQRFSRIVSVEVIEHLDERHIGPFFDTIRDLLAPGGLVVVTTPNEENMGAAEIYCPCCDHVFHRYQHVRAFSAATLAATVSANGLVPIRTFTTDFSRRPWWHFKQIARDLVSFGLGLSRGKPHLVCVASKLA
jgi:2-polyprenyl-3-methyl-5-hydroxy-6-metoxy-1,4-benzoquinol methylase